MSDIERSAGPFEFERPAWWTPGMADSDVRIWKAAQRAAESAPELSPADDVYLALRPLLGGLLARPRVEHDAA